MDGNYVTGSSSGGAVGSGSPLPNAPLDRHRELLEALAVAAGALLALAIVDHVLIGRGKHD